MQVKKQQLEPNMAQQIGSKLGMTFTQYWYNVKILYIGSFQAGIKIAGRNINNLRCADDTTLVAESEEELKSLLMNVKEESEKLA